MQSNCLSSISFGKRLILPQDWAAIIGHKKIEKVVLKITAEIVVRRRKLGKGPIYNLALVANFRHDENYRVGQTVHDEVVLSNNIKFIF